jgi:hypothetical protein
MVLAAAVLLFQLLQRQKDHPARTRPVTTEDYLYKVARITGASEYEIFRRSAEDWPVSQSMVDRDFKTYLLDQSTPCYVNAFLRKHKRQIDHLELPPF